MESENVRTINQLYEVPMSEMTQEELDIWLEYKCSLAARDAAYEARNLATSIHLQSVAEVYGNKADDILSTMKRKLEEKRNG